MNDNDKMLALFNSMDDASDIRENCIRAPFSYIGSKKDSLKHILPLLPYTNTFVEVFGGSGSVLLSRKESNLEVFNDRFSGVVCFYKCLTDRAKLDALIDRLDFFIHARELFRWSADTWENCDDEVERAARWFASVQYSFAGRGKYFGRVIRGKSNLWSKIRLKIPDFEIIHHRLKKVQVDNIDWRDCLKDYDSDDTVFYLDPPYVSGARIYQHYMQPHEHIELCERIFELKGFVALSGYENDIYGQYKWDSVESWDVRNMVVTQATDTNTSRTVGCDYLNRDPRIEHLYIKRFYD